MTPQEKQLIADNPNLSATSLSRLIGVSTWFIRRERKHKPLWTHSGKGIPFTSVGWSEAGGLQYKIRCKNKTIVTCPSLKSVSINVDRLIYCLENNNGKLPRTLEQRIFEDLPFKSRKI